MTPRLRFGILGYGAFAERAIGPAIQASSKAELVALQKRSLAAAREKARAAGVPHAFGSVEDLVASPDVDAVFIVSANAAHCPETIAAAEAGKHVLVEKPMALSVAESERMIAACRTNNVLLSVGHMVRLSRPVRRVRELVHAGTYGPVTFARADFAYDGRQSRRTWLHDTPVAGGGPLYDIGVHCLDTLRYILGDEVASVRAQLSPLPTPTTTESTANIALQFSRGTLASIYCSYDSPARRRHLEVVCRDAVITVPDFTANNERLVLNIARGSGEHTADRVVETFDPVDLYVEEVDKFAEAILGGREPELSAENGLRNMSVVEEAVRRAQ